MRYQYLQELNDKLTKVPRLLWSTTRSVLNFSSGALPLITHVHKIGRLSEILNTYKKNGLSDIYHQHYNVREVDALLPAIKQKVGLLDDLGKVNHENDFMNTCLALDYNTYMVDDILVKVDRATMSTGLEGREPLLDNRIIEFVSQLPSELKYHHGEKKYLLKKITYKYLPKTLMDRPKAGFSIPMNEWFRNDLKSYLFEFINEKQLSKHNLINVKKAISVRDEFLSGKEFKETQVWLLLTFQMWWNRWMEN